MVGLRRGSGRALPFGVAALLALLLSLAPALADDPYFDAPRVIVYPFTTSGDTLPSAGEGIATGLADRLARLGGTAAVPVTPGTARAQFLTNAVSQNADYYVTGFVTTIGREVSFLVQLVSTHSGTVVWSNSWLISSMDDALSHAPDIRAALLRHAGRTLAAYENPEPAPTGAPKATPGPSGHVTDILGGVLHHGKRGRATPAPSASPHPIASPAPAVATATPSPTAAPTPAPTGAAAVAVAAAPTIALLAVGGDAERTARAHAGLALADALTRSGFSVRVSEVPSAAARARARDVCAASPATTVIAAATLHVDERLIAELALTSYDCNGRALTLDAARHPALARKGFISVIDGLAARAVASYLRRSPPPANRANRAGGS